MTSFAPNNDKLLFTLNLWPLCLATANPLPTRPIRAWPFLATTLVQLAQPLQSLENRLPSQPAFPI